jgi:hypothetical protein
MSGCRFRSRGFLQDFGQRVNCVFVGEDPDVCLSEPDHLVRGGLGSGIELAPKRDGAIARGTRAICAGQSPAEEEVEREIRRNRPGVQALDEVAVGRDVAPGRDQRPPRPLPADEPLDSSVGRIEGYVRLQVGGPSVPAELVDGAAPDKAPMLCATSMSFKSGNSEYAAIVSMA